MEAVTINGGKQLEADHRCVQHCGRLTEKLTDSSDDLERLRFKPN